MTVKKYKFMISYLSWKVKFVWEKFTILNVNWVGYKIWTTADLISTLKIDEEKEFWTFTNVKEAELSLFWFTEKDQLDFFEILIWVNWVWPKTALEILALPIDTLKTAIVAWETATLKQVKWIGQKAAERLIVELKNKIWDFEITALSNSNSWTSAEIFEEAILALETLGFKKSEIVKKIRNAPEQETSEDLVTWFLTGSA